MLPTVDFLTWSIGAGNNAMSQASYAANPAQSVGVSVGIADPTLYNKAQRQASVVISTLATLMAAVTNNNILDDANQPEFWKNLWETVLGASFFPDTGAANAWAITAPYSLTFDAPFAGLRVTVKVLHTITGATTFAFMGHTPVAVQYSGSALAAGDVQAGAVVDLVFDGTVWQLIAPTAEMIGTIYRSYTQLLADYGAGGPGTYSFTVPANVYALFGQIVGGGGSGGAVSSVWGGGGGGSGGYAEGWFAVTPGQVLTIVVGAGGAAATPGNDGSAGGSSSISSSGMAATGGGGGIANSGAGAATGGESGVGTAATGQFQCQGGEGGDGFLRAACNAAGNGAASFFGGGSRGSSVTLADNQAFGAGGGGSYFISGGTPNSGAGAQGNVLIWG